MAKITFENKVNLTENPDIPRINKIIDDDLNEIKNVINLNDDNFTNLKTRKNIFTGSTPVGNVVTINQSWEQLGKFKNLIILIFDEVQNISSFAIIPFELMSLGNDLFNGRKNTNVNAFFAYNAQFVALNTVPFFNIGLDQIYFGSSNLPTAMNITEMWIDY